MLPFIATLAASVAAGRVGVLVHGFDLGGEDWEQVVWGSPKEGRLGRVSHGLLLAGRFDATVVLLGSGGTCDENGVSEAVWTRSHALAHVSDLAAQPYANVGAIRRMLKRRVILLEDARNTLDELEAARVLFRRHSIDTVIVVSSPTHAPRCLRDAARVFGAGATTCGDSAAQVRHIYIHYIIYDNSHYCHEDCTPSWRAHYVVFMCYIP